MNDITNLDKLPKGNRTKIVITNLNKYKKLNEWLNKNGYNSIWI